MSDIVKLHPNIVLTDGVLKAKGLAWGGNALQTVTIVRRTPVNPQQAIGYKGIVDYTSGVVTSDVTLDCILTENCTPAAESTSVYEHAETSMILGEESYVLTSCNLTFQAGNPATVNYGYITAGLATALATGVGPDVLLAGEEASFAVVMGEDGSGITLIALKGGTAYVIPAGTQNLSFNSSLNRNQILDVRSSAPIQFITTYPLDITMSMESLQSLGATMPESIEVKAGASTAGIGLETTPLGHVSDGTNANDDGVSQPSDRSKADAGLAGASKLYAKASGLKKTEENESVNVGGNLTFTYSFNVADLQIPLLVDGVSGS